MSDQVIPTLNAEPPTTSTVPAAPAAPPVVQTPAVPLDRNRIEYATDGQGRSIGVRRLTMVKRYNLMAALGAEVASNPVTSVMAQTAACAVSISGVDLPEITSEIKLNFTLQQLDDEGYLCVREVLADKFAPMTKDQLKNA